MTFFFQTSNEKIGESGDSNTQKQRMKNIRCDGRTSAATERQRRVSALFDTKILFEHPCPSLPLKKTIAYPTAYIETSRITITGL